MKIGIFGLGYVGMTTAACLIQKGFNVIGYELSDAKRAELEAGRCPLSEPGVEPVLQEGLRVGSFKAVKNLDPADLPELIFICVGTPSGVDGATDLTAVRSVFSSLESLLIGGVELELDIALRSTVPPGTLRRMSLEFPKVFNQIPVLFYPEFLREGTAMRDFIKPPQTILGVLPGGLPPRRMPHLMAALGFEYELVTAASAESVKFACNAFHALKVCFANEVGRLAASIQADGNEIMRLFCKDTVLNISSRYLLPGNPYGGSCLPKDTRAFAALGKSLGLDLPLIRSAESSNLQHLDFLADRIMEGQPETVCVLGLAFKKDTDDVRESASLALVEQLAKEHEVRVQVHDFLVQPDKVVGVNRKALEQLLALPGVEFSVDPVRASQNADVVVIMHRDQRYNSADAPSGARVLNVAEWLGI